MPRHLRLPFGTALLAVGILLLTSGVRTTRRAGAPINPTRAAHTLITAGPFRFTRNPLYLSLAVIYSGIALLLGALWALLALPFTLLVVSKGVIAPEERYLDATFGEAYRRYQARVRRWL